VSQKCLHPEELADLVEQIVKAGGLDPDRQEPDPRQWQHLQSCPRCRALLAAYRAFMEPEDVPLGADLDDARRRLRQALEQEIHFREADDFSPWRRFLGSLVTPAWRPALAAAALLVVVFGIYQVVDPGPGHESPPVLRGERQVQDDVITGAVAKMLADGRYRLSWNAAALVDSYLVIFYDTTLTELAPLSAGAGTELVLDPAGSDQPAGAGPRYWRVLGLRAGDEVARSSLTDLPDR